MKIHLMDLEKITGKLLDSTIMQEETISFSDLMNNIYIIRDEYADERDDIYKQINKERRRQIKKSETEDKEFIKKLLEKKGLK